MEENLRLALPFGLHPRTKEDVYEDGRRGEVEERVGDAVWRGA